MTPNATIIHNIGAPGAPASSVTNPILDCDADNEACILDRFRLRRDTDRNNVFDDARDVLLLSQLKSGKRLKEALLPFIEPTKIKKYKRIAETAFLNKQSYRDRLPREFTILYELAQLDQATFDESFGEGVIHPRMKKTDAIRLKGPVKRRVTSKRVNHYLSSLDFKVDLPDRIKASPEGAAWWETGIKSGWISSANTKPS